MDNNSAQDETPSSTLFISEVPTDTTETDFSNLFQSCNGVLGTRLRWDRNDNLVGFVDFDSEENAVQVKNRFEDGKFQALSNAGMNIHFARQNTRNRDNNSGGNRSRNVSNNSSGGNRRNQSYDNYGGGGSSRRQGGGGNYGNNYGHFPYGGHPYAGAGSAGPIPTDASSTLYVEGVAHDASEREVAHIFRPFPGFQSVRMFTRESRKFPDSTYLLCFVEFDNKHLSTSAMQMLNGYKFDRNDTRGLRISYAANNKGKRAPGSGGGNNGRGDSEENRDQED